MFVYQNMSYNSKNLTAVTEIFNAQDLTCLKVRARNLAKVTRIGEVEQNEQKETTCFKEAFFQFPPLK